MDSIEVVKVLLWAVGGLMGLLTMLIGWIGVRIHDRLEAISVSLVDIRDELKEDINLHGEKITVLYTRCRANHGPMN